MPNREEEIKREFKKLWGKDIEFKLIKPDKENKLKCQ